MKIHNQWKNKENKSKSDSESEKIARNEGLFHLFCIFNRFCESNMNRMMLGAHFSNYLVSRIMGDNISNLGRLSFVDFFQCICNHPCNPQKTASIKQAYDEYARDVLVETQLSVRTRTYPSNKKKSQILGMFDT